MRYLSAVCFGLVAASAAAHAQTAGNPVSLYQFGVVTGVPGNPLSVTPGTGTIFSDQLTPGSGATVGIAPTVTATAAGSLILRAGAGQLYSAYVNNGATAGFLMVFNATTVPADGTVTPIACITAPANVTTYYQPPYPAFLSTGMTLVFSTTGCFTKTIGSGVFLSGQIK